MFQKDLIKISDQKFVNKAEVIAYLSEVPNEGLDNIQLYQQDVMDRETTMSTSIGFNIAIPHAISQAVKSPFVLYLQLNEMLAWDQGEDQVKHVFLIGVPKENGSTQHLKILSELSKNLMRDNFRESLLNAKDSEAIYEILSKLEEGMQIV